MLDLGGENCKMCYEKTALDWGLAQNLLGEEGNVVLCNGMPASDNMTRIF